MMIPNCYVCDKPLQLDKLGRVRLEGVTVGSGKGPWVFGPVLVHDPCRLELKTPYDERVGDGRYMATWQLLTLQDWAAEYSDVS